MIKHSKYKNSGILYELLVRQITSEILAGKDSPAVGIVKRYYKNTELAKEHKLYNSLIGAKTLNETKAEQLVNAVLEASTKLNKSTLRTEKYNVIKEIKDHYDVNEFFKEKVNNYAQYAAVYNLLEARNSQEFTDPTHVINNKMTILEHISNQSVDQDNIANNFLEEYSKMSKGTRILTYKILLEKFNEKYSGLTDEQKLVLKEYINNIDNSVRLREFINEKTIGLRSELSSLVETIEDDTTKIKLKEVLNLIKPVDKNTSVKDDDVVSLLQYYQLVKEIRDIK